MQPLKSPDLSEAGIPAWAVEFINGVALEHILDLVEAGTMMRIKMYVCIFFFCFIAFLLYRFWGLV